MKRIRIKEAMRVAARRFIRCLPTVLFLVSGGTALGADRTVTFSTSDPGVDKSLEMWGLDLAWRDGNNVRRGAAFTGADKVDVVRISFTGIDPVVNGDLQQADIDVLNLRLGWVDAYANPNTVLYINEDTGDLDPWYLLGNGFVNPLRWAQMVEATTRRAQESGRTVECVLPFNEVDVYTDHRIAYMQTVHETIAEMVKMPRFDDIRISSCALNPDGALQWFDYSKLWLDEAVTHQLGGTFDNYASFFQAIRAQGKRATNDELHNVMEAMVGAEYGLQTGIWWGTADLARGEFVKTSDGQRLGYAEHRDNWTAASVYRAPSGKIQAFVGESERQARPTTYEFYSKDRPVFFDGHGPQRSYVVPTSGGDGYGTINHRGAERVVNITWGEDIQPAITSNRYVVVNRNSHKVMEVASASTANGANIRQNTYAGGLNQQWDIVPVAYTNGGDWSYFKVAAAHSGKSPDVYQFSFDNGGNIVQWDNGGGFGGVNQQWYFEYVEDGWFHIRSRWNNKGLDVSGASTADGANIQQWDVLGDQHQQWRLLPVGAAIEFVAPAAPTGLNATANASSVSLSWNANSESDLAGYTVLRSTTSGGPYEIVGRGIAGTSFTDTEVTSSAQYYYVVKAVDESLNRSANSGEVSCQGGLLNQAPYFAYEPLWRDSAVVGTAFGGSIAGDAIDLDPDTLTFSKVFGPAWLNVAANGALSGTPAVGDAGNNSWVVRISDGHGGTDDAVLNIAVDYPVTVSVYNMHSGTTAGLVPGNYTRSQLSAAGMPDNAISSFHIEPGYKLVIYREDNFQGDSATHAHDITGLWYSGWDNDISSLRVQVIGNAPYFDLNPFTKKPAEIGVAYSETIWNAAHDPDFDSLSYTKISGPSWLAVSSGGALSGTPGAGDVGLNSWVVRVSDGNGGTNDATLEIAVMKAPSLVARYGFESNVLDSSGSGLNGTAFGNPAYVAGMIGQAIDLDGSDDRISLPSGVANAVDFTVACWVNWDGGGAWQRIFDFGNNTSQYMFLSPNGSGGGLRFEIKNGSQLQSMQTALLPTGTWTHVAVTLNGRNARLYVNGAQVATDAFFVINPYDFKPTNNLIGDSQFAADPLFNGRIDDFRIYNHGLSASEVAVLAGAPTGLGATAVSTSQINLEWSAALGASSYTVKRATVSGGPYTTIATGVTGTSYSNTGLAESSTYYYVVSAINASGESTDSMEAIATTLWLGFLESSGVLSMEAENGSLGSRWITGSDAAASNGEYIEVDPQYDNPTGAPAGTASEYLAAYDFKISTGGNYRFWFRMYSNANVDDSFFWRIDEGAWILENGRYGIGSWFSTDNVQVDSLSAGTHVLQIAYRENGTRLDKFVIQLDGATAPSGDGPPESMQAGDNEPPAGPTGLMAVADDGSVSLDWGDNTEPDLAGYNVYRDTESGVPYTRIATEITTSGYVDHAVVNGTRYYYVVSAVGTGGESTYSIEASAVPSAAVSSNEFLFADHAIVGGTNLSLTVSNSVPGHDYGVLATDTLTPSDWTNILVEAGNGSNLLFSIPIGSIDTNRFFKLDVQRQ